MLSKVKNKWFFSDLTKANEAAEAADGDSYSVDASLRNQSYSDQKARNISERQYVMFYLYIFSFPTTLVSCCISQFPRET